MELAKCQLENFWRKVEKTNTCWFWRGATAGYAKEYGIVRLDGIIDYAHRISYELHKRKIGKDEIIHHTCGHRNCVNPDHLEAVTHGKHMAYRFKGSFMMHPKSE